MGGHPVKFRVMGFQPISTKDDIMGANVGDVEFRVFLVIVLFEGLDMDSLDCCRADRASFI